MRWLNKCFRFIRSTCLVFNIRIVKVAIFPIKVPFHLHFQVIFWRLGLWLQAYWISHYQIKIIILTAILRLYKITIGWCKLDKYFQTGSPYNHDVNQLYDVIWGTRRRNRWWLKMQLDCYWRSLDTAGKCQKWNDYSIYFMLFDIDRCYTSW